MIAEHPEGGLYTATSGIDGVTRRYAVRPVNGTPLYVQAGIATPPFAMNGSGRWPRT